MIITLVIKGEKCQYEIKIINMSLLKHELDVLLTTSYTDADGNKAIPKLAQIIAKLLDLYTDYLQGTSKKPKSEIQKDFADEFVELMSYKPNMDESFQPDLEEKNEVNDEDNCVNITESYNTITCLFTMEKLPLITLRDYLRELNKTNSDDQSKEK